jgi:hypothetical protein
MKLRFSIRDLLWLTALCAVLMGWLFDHIAEEKCVKEYRKAYQRAEDRRMQGDLSRESSLEQVERQCRNSPSNACSRA